MLADRADFRSFFADEDVTAVAAFPALFILADEDFAALDVREQLLVALFVALFDLGDAGEVAGEGRETFGGSFFLVTHVHIGPLLMFAGGRRDEVGGGVAEQAEFLEPQFRVLLLVVRGLLEDRGDLLIPFLAGDGG